MARHQNSDPLTKAIKESSETLQLYKLADAGLDELVEFTRRMVADDAQYIGLAKSTKAERSEKSQVEAEQVHYVEIEDDKSY